MWILDCACSYHICYIRDFFSSYSTSTGSVLMGNDHPCQIEGIGSVKIQMFDGTVRIVTDVRYIPDMRKNLLSLGVLDANGHQWSVIDGELQVLRRGKVILKGSRQKNLYVLQGNTVCGEANVTQSQDEITRLWHLRLGHMSEKGLAVLHKKGLISGWRLAN